MCGEGKSERLCGEERLVFSLAGAVPAFETERLLRGRFRESVDGGSEQRYWGGRLPEVVIEEAVARWLWNGALETGEREELGGGGGKSFQFQVIRRKTDVAGIGVRAAVGIEVEWLMSPSLAPFQCCHPVFFDAFAQASEYLPSIFVFSFSSFSPAFSAAELFNASLRFS